MKKNKNYCTIYIVRHGETEWNVQRRFQGQQDSPLTEKGIQQAKDIAKKFKSIHFDAIFSSDLLRAKRTADIIAIEHKLAVQTNTLLRERHFGKLEGVTIEKYKEEFKELYDLYDTLSESEKVTFQFANEENDQSLIARFITYIREIAITFAGQTILIASHSAMMKAFLIHIGYATYATLPSGTIHNTAYVRLESDGIDFFITETEGIHKKTI